MMRELLQYFNPTNPEPTPSPLECGRLWGPPDDHKWIKLTIAIENDGVFLFTTYTNGWQADSWYESVEEAKQQAKFGYGIEENDWEECRDK